MKLTHASWICTAVVSRAGGQGSNDEDYYSGGSLVFNLVTIFDPQEKFRRDRANENDGGLLRHVYETGPWPQARGHITAFEHGKDTTYAAADLTIFAILTAVTAC